MKATYDQRTDTLTLVRKDNATVTESDAGKPGVILDHDADGNLVSTEVLDASKRVTQTNRIELEMVGSSAGVARRWSRPPSTVIFARALSNPQVSVRAPA